MLVRDRGEFREGIGILVERMCNASVPIAAVASIAVDLVQHGVQPIRGGIALVPLGDRVRGLPVSGESAINSVDQLFFAACHFSKPLARRSHAGQCPQP